MEVLRGSFFASLVGIVLTFPVQWVLKPAGVTWREALAVIVILLLLAGLNLLCVADALASV